MARRNRPSNLPAPFLRQIRIEPDLMPEERAYPFDLPWLSETFELRFEEPVTIIMGENGTGKSTLIEAIAKLAGYDEAGGGKGYVAVDHSQARDVGGSLLASALRAAWLPKVTAGWFFRAETFFSVARYLDEAGSPTADFLSWSHGEGFARFFEEWMGRQGIYFMDEPESALSPRRQVELLRFLAEIQERADRQVICATHSPLLMAVPGAAVLEVTRHGLAPVDYRDTGHFRMWQDFTLDPLDFVHRALTDPDAL